MKGYVCLFLLLVAPAVLAQSNGSPDEAAVLGLQRHWLEASQTGDAGALRQIIDDSFVGNTPDNHIISKQTLFPPSGTGPMFANSRFANLTTKVVGDTAVVFGGMITTGDPTVLRFTMVYAKRSGTWKMIAAQFVPVTEAKDGGGQ